MATANPNKPTRKPRAQRQATTADTGENIAAAQPSPAPGKFKFDLKSSIMIAASREQGQIRARAEWATGNVSYYVAYTSTTGEYREAWIDQDLLSNFVERRAANRR